VAAEDYRGSQATLEQVKRQVGATARAVTDVTGGVLVDRLRDEISDRSAQAAAELTAFAQAMRAGSGSLRDQGHDTQASVVEDAARRADRLAAHLSRADSETLMADAKRLSRKGDAFIREEPLLVPAAAFALGLLITRWLRGAPTDS
jgi:hypothetical protein